MTDQPAKHRKPGLVFLIVVLLVLYLAGFGVLFIDEAVLGTNWIYSVLPTGVYNILSIIYMPLDGLWDYLAPPSTAP